ncbi:MAG: antitoxin [Zoogloeaceae bacterium]|nr:antitoxin [Zoogloeaceae bacterium]
MMLAKIFQSGNSQAVRLPREFRFDVDQVEIYRRGDEVVLRPVVPDATAVFDALTGFPDDFMAEGRTDDVPQEREAL